MYINKVIKDLITICISNNLTDIKRIEILDKANIRYRIDFHNNESIYFNNLLERV